MPSLVYRGAANCDHRQSSGERRALEVKPRDHTGGHRLARLACVLWLWLSLRRQTPMTKRTAAPVRSLPADSGFKHASLGPNLQVTRTLVTARKRQRARCCVRCRPVLKRLALVRKTYVARWNISLLSLSLPPSRLAGSTFRLLLCSTNI